MDEILEAIWRIEDIYRLNDRRLAKKLGVDPATICRIKSGKTKPSLQFLNALAVTFPETRLLIYECITRKIDWRER